MQLNKEQVNRTLEVSIKEGNYYSFMTGFYQGYITAFVEFLKATPLQISYIATLPGFIASIIQLSTVRINNLIGSRKNSLFILGTLQSVCILMATVIAGFYPTFQTFLIVNIFISIFDQLTVTIWTSLMGDVVPENIRGRFFGKKARINGIYSTISIILAGLILQKISGYNESLGFAVIFFIGSISRLFSGLLYLKHYDPKISKEKINSSNIFSFIYTNKHTLFLKYIFYSSIYTYINSWGIAVYTILFLRYFNFSYLQYSIIIFIIPLTSYISNSVWGYWSDYAGNRKVMLSGYWILTLLPFNWFFCLQFFEGHVAFMLVVINNIIAGIAWAGIHLGSFNYILDTVDQKDKMVQLTYLKAINGFFIFVGALTGAFFAEIDSILPNITSMSLINTPYIIPILLCGIGRIFMLMFFNKFIKETKSKIRDISVFKLIASIPIQGFLVDTDFVLKKKK